MKFHEDEVLNIVRDYIQSTYSSHYAEDEETIQPNDLIISNGDGPPFFRSNAIKYLSRMEKKGTPKLDLLKAIHYSILLYSVRFYETDQGDN